MSLTLETFEEIIAAKLPVICTFVDGFTFGLIPHINREFYSDRLNNKLNYVIFHKTSSLNIMTESKSDDMTCGTSGRCEFGLEKAFEIVQLAQKVTVPISGNKILPNHANIIRYSHDVVLSEGRTKYEDRLNDLLSLIRLEHKLLSS